MKVATTGGFVCSAPPQPNPCQTQEHSACFRARWLPFHLNQTPNPYPDDGYSFGVWLLLNPCRPTQKCAHMFCVDLLPFIPTTVKHHKHGISMVHLWCLTIPSIPPLISFPL